MNLLEVIKIALFAVRANKLRSILTLLGVVVGVFSIIAVMTALQVLQNSIESGLSQLGTNTFQIQRMPNFASRAEWLKALSRKKITYDQARRVGERITLAELVGIEGWQGGLSVQAQGNKTNPNVALAGENVDGVPTNNWAVKDGRSLSDNDLLYASDVAIIGPDVASKVFPKGNALGSIIKAGSFRYTVVGVFEEKGAMLGGSQGNFIVIPLSTFLNQYGRQSDLHIMIKSKSTNSFDECLDEARFILRTIRNVDPGKDDDFAVFSNDSMIQTFNDFTLYVKMGVGFISFIALLAAGVGIMNIMLVSVTERTKEIGIRKAIGARKSNILGQFVTEAVVLCQLGGIVGILLGVLGGNLAAIAFSIPPVFPYDWALIGFALCSFIGVAFGVYPAWKAANLDPIESLRYE
jgi:putative ABC transport system permease protein